VPMSFSGRMLRVTHSGRSQATAGSSSFHVAVGSFGRQSRSFRHSIGRLPLCQDGRWRSASDRRRQAEGGQRTRWRVLRWVG